MHYPHTTKDNKGNVIHYKDSNGYEYWKDYDSNNNRIHYKDSKGVECWFKYDSNNNVIHYKESNGYEYWHDYDSNNNIIHYKNSKGVEDWYDSDGNRIDDPDKVIEKRDEARAVLLYEQGGIHATAMGWAAKYAEAIEQRDSLAEALRKLWDNHTLHGAAYELIVNTLTAMKGRSDG